MKKFMDKSKQKVNVIHVNYQSNFNIRAAFFQ